MTNSIRANDILVRIGGEEFAIIMPQTGKDEAFHVLERIRNNVSVMVLPGVKDGAVSRLTISTGVAMYPECGESIESIIVQADKALYSAKMNGKNRTVTWYSGMDFKTARPAAMNETGIRKIEISPNGKFMFGNGGSVPPSSGGPSKQNPEEPFKGFII